MRVPGLFWLPGRIRPGVVAQMGCQTDLLATCLKLAGAAIPTERPLDSLDLSPALLGQGPSPRDTMFYYRDTRLFAVRHGPFKAHFWTQSSYGKDQPIAHDPPLLYNLEQDPSEKYDVGPQHPEAVAEIRRLMAAHQQGMHAAPTQLEAQLPKAGK